MSKTIATENAPAAIGPYVQGVDLGNMIITSGQIPVNPKTGEVPADVAAQARQSLDNVKAIWCRNHGASVYSAVFRCFLYCSLCSHLGGYVVRFAHRGSPPVWARSKRIGKP